MQHLRVHTLLAGARERQHPPMRSPPYTLIVRLVPAGTSPLDLSGLSGSQKRRKPPTREGRGRLAVMDVKLPRRVCTR